MNGSPPQTVIPPQLLRRVLLVVMAWLAPTAPFAVSLVGLSLGLSVWDILWSLLYLLPPVFLLAGVGLPLVGNALLLREGFRARPEEPPQERLARLQMLPWKLSLVSTLVAYLVGGALFSLPLVIRFNKSLLMMGLGLLVAAMIGQVLSLPVGIQLEKLLMPFVLEERNRLRVRASGKGLFWPRQRWYLPAACAVTLTSILLICGLVFVLQTLELRDAQTRALLADPSLPQDQAQLIADRLRAYSNTLLSCLGPPLLLLGAFVLVVPSLSAWMMARRHVRATAALQEAIAGLANGTPMAPAWASSDELGDLAADMVTALEHLQEIPTRLQASASLLLSASTALGSASHQQRQRITEQASMLQEAQLTSEEIRTTSDLASHKAESVLSVAGHAEKLGQYGEESIERTLTGLNTIGDFVDGIRGKVMRLQESATQIANIAVTVKDLADQSHLLALNASIEAARAGDQGAGFAVVASEIRKLADQSIRETALIRKSLLDIGTAIRDVVSMSEQGARQVEGGLEMVKSSGNNLREMSLIIQENAAAVRQITVAVNQQNTGISHIFNAIAHISAGMDETMKRLDTTLQATETLQAVTREVTEIARRYQLNRKE
ncbi:methyl-accepting chemotaxis protein [Vitiosangium sp. GDMCC 1.1324]|uniref:methyl-accepting chemotaxis protein n=1 Tax=Vitiosangium sp. (strain GDMCC 1.1324) TaxID=2138576 RepID=UPI000D3BCAEA|nr:methyl-accepting chemotaxis protein [Vitiosangium sp. GDMCC 1.1324]PTL83986.1 methyl-accepting chemotaxis protein [Vitiosangium sp. GDMCC 1.1324]